MTDPISPPEEHAFPQITAKSVLRALLGLGLAGAMIGWGMPYVAKTSWSHIAEHLARVGWSAGFELFGLVIFGLWLYTFTLTGSLPGLSHLKALVLNVAGSAASNLLPGGGAVGMAATYLIARSWGFRRRAISTSLIVSGIWNILGRIALPLIGIAVVATSGNALPRSARTAALYAGLTGLAVLAVFVGVIVSPKATDWVGREASEMFRPLLARFGKSEVNLHELIVDQRRRMASVTRTGWLPMTVGVLGFLGVYFILFWRTMQVVGVDLPVAEIFAAYAIGRLLSAVGVTPGGLGITEAGTLAVLVAWGADRPAAAAGVVVFAIFSHLLEVPLGALGWLAWWLSPKVPAAD